LQRKRKKKGSVRVLMREIFGIAVEVGVLILSMLGSLSQARRLLGLIVENDKSPLLCERFIAIV
jgi:hypothetical protein